MKYPKASEVDYHSKAYKPWLNFNPSIGAKAFEAQEKHLKNVRAHNKRNRAFYESDTWIQQQRTLARKRLNAATRSNGLLAWSKLPKLLGTNPKLEKSNDGNEYLTAGQSFAPSYASGYNMCSFATACAVVCLFGSGHGQRHMMNGENHVVTQARLIRTWIYLEYPAQYKQRIFKEIRAHVKKAQRMGAIPAVRMNVISDRLWEKELPEIFLMFPEVQFYDYTAVVGRDVSHIPNYHLVYSRKEDNEDVVFAQKKHNISVVFRVKKGDNLPTRFNGLRVVDADKHDMIWKWAEMYPGEQVVLGLRPKGKDAWKDTSGFIRNVPRIFNR